ncbi:MAG: T9SS type A sorting domain-containing protein [Flavobacteriales bacterium]|nr:T9SS type A sorting domain-containing protein [Flavobacteriales bacterium]
MKSFYLLLLPVGLLFANLTYGQFDSSPPPTQNNTQKINFIQEAKASTTCGNDTLLYTLSKTTWPEIQTVNDTVFYNKVAQRFENSDSITVYGMCYYALNNVAGSGPVGITLNMHEVAIDSFPSTILASAVDTVPIGSGTVMNDFRRCVTWATPVITDKDFYVSVDGSGTLTEPLGVYRNSSAFDDGAGEILSAVYYDDGSAGSWVKWYLQTSIGWNYDYLLEPIVSYDLLISSTVTSDTSCAGDEVCIELDSISPIYYNKFFNTNIAAMPVVDFGDGNTATSDSACNIYTTVGNYNLTHTLLMSGWTTSCSVAHVDSVLIEQSVAGFTYTISNDTVVFTNTSTGSTGGLWTFGTLGTSSALDSTYVFPSNGSYDIEQIVWSSYGCADTVTQTINITVGLEENNLPQISMYPNPTNGILHLVNSGSSEKFNVVIMDMTGKLLSHNVINGSVNTIDLSLFSEGQYIVRLSNDSGFRVERIQVIK